MDSLRINGIRFIAAVICLLAGMGLLLRLSLAADADSTIDTIIAGVEARYNVPDLRRISTRNRFSRPWR